MKKKTIILIAIIVISIVSIFIWSISVPSRLVYFGGSSSVNPFMQIATKKFDEQNDDYEVIYNSNGSQNGIRSVENDTYSAGMISKEVDENTLTNGSDFSHLDYKELTLDNIDKFSEDAKANEDIHPVEFAIDAIVIMYNPPKWISDDKELLNSIDIDLSKESKDDEIIKNIYSNSNYKWIDFLKDINKGDVALQNKITQNQQKAINGGNEVMMPISREAGSGTRGAFDHIFNIKDVDSGTANSNGSMITQLRDTKGSFGYVSYGFYKKNESSNLFTPWFDGQRLSNGENIETLVDGEITQAEKTNEDYIKDDYLLKRPFIMLFKGDDKKANVVLDFIKFLIEEQSKIAFEEEGLVKNIEYIQV